MQSSATLRFLISYGNRENYLCRFAKLLFCKRIKTDRLCVLYDAGETTALLPILQKWEAEQKDFRLLVMATAETLVRRGVFGKKRLELQNLHVADKIDAQTDRTIALSSHALRKIAYFKPKLVLVGTASRIQQQILELFPTALTVAYADNFNYDPQHISFATAKRIQSVAKHVLCPSQQAIELFSNGVASDRYFSVGKPSLESWEKEIAAVDRTHICRQLGLEPHGQPIITFLGGYGYGYDVINPLFAKTAAFLRAAGYQVFIQPHPKLEKQIIKTPEALAISDYVVGYNSSVVLDASLIGKNALFLIPKTVPYHHFAIDQGLIAQVADETELLAYVRGGSTAKDVRTALKIPTDSMKKICELIEHWLVHDD